MEYTVFLILAPISFAITYLTIVITWKYRHERLGKCLLVYFFAILLFLLSNVMELIAVNEQMILLWTKIQISIYGFIPVVWLIFSLIYSNNEKLLRGIFSYWKILIIPILSVFFVSLYPHISIFYTGHSVLSFKQFSTLSTEYGFFFWIYGAYSYILFILGSILIILHLTSNGFMFHRLSLFIVLGSLFPLIANILYILPLPIFAQKDFTPIALAISGLFFFIGIYWHRFLEIIPIARNLIVEEMDQGIIILDKSELIIDINKTAMRLFGISGEILGRSIRDVSEIWDVISHSYTRKGSTFEALIKSDEIELNCSITAKPISMDIQEQLGILITINDITMLVNLFDEKMKLLSQMEDTYIKLNSTQLQLIHKEKLASIGQVAAGMAHEIKNPLSFIQSNQRFLEKYIKQIFDQDQNMDVDEIRSEIDDILFDSQDGLKRILAVVNSLLDFSRNDNERKLERTFDINIALDECLKILKGNMDPAIKVKKEYTTLDEIICYGSEIKQVFLNLLNNAYQATGNPNQGMEKIIIRTMDQGDSVSVEILNTGERIDPKLRQKIFEPFYTTKPTGKGTGLGLSIVSDIIIKRHNGIIQVLEENGLTKFKVSLKKVLDNSLISPGSLEFVLQETEHY